MAQNTDRVKTACTLVIDINWYHMSFSNSFVTLGLSLPGWGGVDWGNGSLGKVFVMQAWGPKFKSPESA